MSSNPRFTAEQAREIGARIGIDWSSSAFDIETNVTDDDEVTTGKIALAHLREFPDYYTRLAKMEQEAEDFWEGKQGG